MKWIGLSAEEQRLVERGLDRLRQAAPDNAAAVDLLSNKLRASKPYPEIAVGVYGGQVQWSHGNPFPIRIVDYDGDEGDFCQVDGEGFPCRSWEEETSPAIDAYVIRKR